VTPVRRRVRLAGVDLDAVSADEVVARVRAAWDAGDGGWIVTPNVDILRLAAADPEVRALVGRADLAVADGMPLLWAARLGRHPLPGRVTGGDLLDGLARAAAADGRSVFLLGGEEGVPQRAAAVLRRRYPGLTIAGALAPPFGFDGTPEGVERVRAAVVATSPDVVFVGLGFPRQERLIEVLRRDLPHAWMLGCGAAIPFTAGAIERAPGWMQRSGLEWVHRLVTEPRRLAGRYLAHDLPFAVSLLTRAARGGVRPVDAAPATVSAEPVEDAGGELADAGDLVVGESIAEGAEGGGGVHGAEGGARDSAAQ
jgi:N-acetylglucosaminyldiphosphoundecaprenol N-acetyl-beta-D-mannosaminyltransferase